MDEKRHRSHLLQQVIASANSLKCQREKKGGSYRFPRDRGESAKGCQRKGH